MENQGTAFSVNLVLRKDGVEVNVQGNDVAAVSTAFDRLTELYEAAPGYVSENSVRYTKRSNGRLSGYDLQARIAQDKALEVKLAKERRKQAREALLTRDGEE